jgi:hypothetical protein
LLPEVFDSSKAFSDWFSKPFQRDGPTHSEEEDDWLETEKKVIIIHRLHQILEPFMLRRRVEDVEGSLPRKVLSLVSLVNLFGNFITLLIGHVVVGFHCFEMQNVCRPRSYL